LNNAIYYEGAYYLVPAEFDDYEMFIQDLHEQTLPAKYSMIELREDHKARNFSVIKGRSMAPYFLSGYHDEPSMVTIENREIVYPVHVEVMDQTEYNAHLREVINRVCPGCLRFKPLSNRVQSLNGHFEKMTLDGVCVFRQESKPAPRSFHHHLFSFGGFFVRFDYASKNAQEMHDNIKQWFYASYADAQLEESNGHKTLTLRCKKNELLTPVLTEAVSRYIAEISKGTYHIRLAEDFSCSENLLTEMLLEVNSKTFRKECKKYGVSLAVLEYDEHASEKVRHSLKELVNHFWVFPLLQSSGKDYYLVSDTSYVLKELRYRSPLLQAHHASVSIFDQYRNSRYQISFDMKQTRL